MFPWRYAVNLAAAEAERKEVAELVNAGALALWVRFGKGSVHAPEGVPVVDLRQDLAHPTGSAEPGQGSRARSASAASSARSLSVSSSSGRRASRWVSRKPRSEAGSWSSRAKGTSPASASSSARHSAGQL